MVMAKMDEGSGPERGKNGLRQEEVVVECGVRNLAARSSIRLVLHRHPASRRGRDYFMVPHWQLRNSVAQLWKREWSCVMGQEIGGWWAEGDQGYHQMRMDLVVVSW
jgi:hypothetical protein